tara:strand:+ start:7697 stop:9448 length:1752 start_codon:yes stop_codon:yes gene_type:complete
MAYGSSSQLSYLGTMAVGVLNDGTGLTPGTKELVALTKATANGHVGITSSARNATNQPDSNAIDTLGNRDISGFGAFTGVVPSTYTSTVGTGLGMDRLAAHVNLMFGTGPIQMAQTFFISNSLVSSSKRIAPSLQYLNDGVEFGKFPDLDSKTYPANGIFPNYLGEGYPDMQAVVTNGISTLVKEASSVNFNLLAQDITNLGIAFNLNDIGNFGNPGQVIQALNNVDGISVTGIDTVMGKLGIDPSAIFNLADTQYNVLMQKVLDIITVPNLISNAQSLLSSNIVLEKLGDYTDFSKIFVNSKDIITFKNMDEFKSRLQAIELGNIDNLTQLADYITRVTTVDLPTIHNITNFTKREYVDSLIAKFLGGTGPNGSITMTDMIGSLGAVGVTTPASAYRTALQSLQTAGELTTLQTHITQLANGLNGNFTSGSVGNLTLADPDGPSIGPVADPYPSFQANKIGQIETDCANLMSRRNVNADIQTLINNWNTLFKKVFDEKDFQSRIDMNYSIRTNFSDNALNFVQSLRGTILQDEKKAIVTGMIDQAIKDGDIGGEYFRAYIKELENKEAANIYDIRWRSEFDS